MVGLVRLPLRAPGIRLEPELEERVVVSLPSDHALEEFDRVSLEAIADLPLIFFTRQLIPGFHAQIVESCQRADALPKVAQHAVHLQTIVGLVASGVGLAILPGSAEWVSREAVLYCVLDALDVHFGDTPVLHPASAGGLFEVLYYPYGYVVEALYAGQALLSRLLNLIPVTILGSLADIVMGGQHILVGRNQPFVDRLQILRWLDLTHPAELSTGLIPGY